MSAGPGHIMRAIATALERAEPWQAHSVEDLCREAFPGLAKIQKKHRVAVIRAMGRVAQGSGKYCFEYCCRAQGDRPGAPHLIMFQRHNLQAITLALRGKGMWIADDWESYRHIRERFG